MSGPAPSAPYTEHGYIQWTAFKAPEMKCWAIRDDLGFTMLTHDRDGWSAKRIAETLNLGEAVRTERLGNPKEAPA